MIQTTTLKIALSLSGVNVVSSFNTLVKPIINPPLSNYITQLTGIEQYVLDDMGVNYQAVLLQLYSFFFKVSGHTNL